MKASKKVFAIFAMTALVLGASSAKTAKNKVNKIERVNWQGAEVGREIPDWVEEVADGNVEKVKKQLKLDGYKIWVFSDRGTDLEFLRAWTDETELMRRIAGSVSTSIATAAEASAEYSSVTDEQKKSIKAITTALSNCTITGMDRKASFWVQTRQVRPGLKKAKTESDYIISYIYYSVWAVKEDLYEKQVDNAMKNSKTYADQDPGLRQILTAALAKSIGQTVPVSNEEEFTF